MLMAVMWRWIESSSTKRVLLRLMLGVFICPVTDANS
jgi:hypothetical protein